MKYTLFLFSFTILIIACKKESTGPAVYQQELQGKWSADQIKGSDSVIYSLNEEVPSYAHWPPCYVFNNKDVYYEWSYDFWSDSNLRYIQYRKHYFRSWQFQNFPYSCEHTFSSWSDRIYSDTIDYRYRVLNENEILLIEGDSILYYDTAKYQLNFDQLRIRRQYDWPYVVFQKQL